MNFVLKQKLMTSPTSTFRTMSVPFDLADDSCLAKTQAKLIFVLVKQIYTHNLGQLTLCPNYVHFRSLEKGKNDERNHLCKRAVGAVLEDR